MNTGIPAQLTVDLTEVVGELLPPSAVAVACRATVVCSRQRPGAAPTPARRLAPLRCALADTRPRADRGAPPPLRPTGRVFSSRRRDPDPQARRKPGGPPRVAAKERISEDPTGLGINVGRHVEIILGYLRDNPGVGRLVDAPGSPKPGGRQYPNGVLVDNNISVSTTRRHQVPPEHQRLMTLINDGKVDVVLTTALSRLWRGATAMQRDLQVMKSRGVTIVCTGADGKGPATYDLTTPYGKLLVEMVTALAEMEASLIRERSRATMALAAKAGAYHGSHSFGYQLAYKVLDNEGRVIAVEPGAAGEGGAERRTLLPLWGGPDHEVAAAYRLLHRRWPDGYTPGEADLVVEMAQRIEADEPLYQLLKDFDERGIKTKTGKKWMDVGTGSIRAIVTAERNVGWKRHLQVDYNPIDDAYEISHEGMEVADWPAILDRELYDRVCKKLEPDALRDDGSGTGTRIPRRTAPTNKRKHLPAGFAVCDNLDKHPGRLVTMKSGHLTGVNARRLGRRARLVCPECSRARDMADVEEKMVLYMTSWTTAGGRYDKTVQRRALEVEQARASMADAEVRQLRADKKKAEDALERAKNFLVDGTLSQADYNTQQTRLLADIAGIDARLPREPEAEEDPLKDWPRGSKFAEKWAQLEARGAETLWERRRVATALIDKVVILAAPRGTPAGRVQGENHRADDRYTVVYPAGWWPHWQPEALPLTLDEMVVDLLERRGGAWTRAEIAEETGIHFDSLHRVLKRLAAVGDLIETWERGRSAEGRATFTYRVGWPIVPLAADQHRH